MAVATFQGIAVVDLSKNAIYPFIIVPSRIGKSSMPSYRGAVDLALIPGT
jgi:hypothetical protein